MEVVVLSRRTLLKSALIAALPNFPDRRPKFQIGDRVECRQICDDELDTELYGQAIWLRGYVTGLVFDHPHLKQPCWSYYVRWTSQKYHSVEPCNIVEWVPEWHLQATYL